MVAVTTTRGTMMIMPMSIRHINKSTQLPMVVIMMRNIIAMRTALIVMMMTIPQSQHNAGSKPMNISC